jgi:hypothetical protein
MSRSETRIAAACAVAGSVLLFAGTYLHPMRAGPKDAVAAFTEYAADRLWVTSHLTQLAGVALMAATLLLLTRQLESASGAIWSRIAAGGAVAGLAVAAALQAVDGVALKVMVDAWAGAPPSEKEVLGDRTFPRWAGTLAIAGGVPTAVAGVVIAYTGFSGLAMSINMPAGAMLLGWMLALGGFLWRRSGGGRV